MVPRSILMHLISFHLGGPYDTVPELCILLSLFESSNKFHPIVFDEAGWAFIFTIGSSEANVLVQVTVSPRSTFSPRSRDISPRRTSCSTERLNRNYQVTLSSALHQASNSPRAASDTCGLW